MQVRVSGRHMGVADTVRKYCEDKAERLVHFYDRVRQVEFVLDGNDGRHTAEVIVHADGSPPFIASVDHDDLHAAVDLLMDKIESQIRRHKERIRNRKHPESGGE